MNREDTIPIGNDLYVPRDQLQALARRFHIRRAAVFGSAARGELRPDSDIDLLVEFEPGQAPSLWAAQELQNLETALVQFRKIAVDLGTEDVPTSH